MHVDGAASQVSLAASKDAIQLEKLGLKMRVDDVMGNIWQEAEYEGEGRTCTGTLGQLNSISGSEQPFPPNFGRFRTSRIGFGVILPIRRSLFWV